MGKNYSAVSKIFFTVRIFLYFHILVWSGISKIVLFSFGFIFHLCFRWYFRKFHIAASMTCITIFFEIFWEVIHKDIFSQKDHVFKDICLQRYKNLACHGRSTLIFLCPTPWYCCFLVRNSLSSYTTDCLCLSIFYLRLFFVSILFSALTTVHLFLFCKGVTQSYFL